MSAMEVKKTQIPARAQQTTIKETTDVNKNISIFEDKNFDGPSQKKIYETLDSARDRLLAEQNKTPEQKEKDALKSADKMINSFKKSLEKVKGNEKASERIQQNINKYEAVKVALTDNSPELKSSEKFQKLKQDYCNSKNEEKFLNEYNKLKEDLKSSKPKQAQQPKAAQQPVQPQQVNKPQQTQAPAAKKEAVKAETAKPQSTEQQLKTEVAELNKKVDEVKDKQRQAFTNLNLKAQEKLNGKPFTKEEREQKLKDLNGLSFDELAKQTEKLSKKYEKSGKTQALSAQTVQPNNGSNIQSVSETLKPESQSNTPTEKNVSQKKDDFHSVKTGGMTWEGIVKTYYPELVDKCGGKMFGADGAIRQLKIALSEGSGIDLVKATDIPKTLNLPSNLNGVEFKDNEYKGAKIRKFGGHTDIAEAGRKTYSA